jgi:diguanylate cyclase (GGDEF)-like protein
MRKLPTDILEQVVAASIEPVLCACIDRPDWPVVLCNPEFQRFTGEDPVLERPLADVVEQLIGRELAVEVSETVRRAEESSLPVEVHKREYLLLLKPLQSEADPAVRYVALFWRRGGGAAEQGDRELHRALLRAKRRVRDLSRDDAATGLLNETAFREVLAHDWAVAKREKSGLALVCFTPDHFEAYLSVFGRHATDSCLRRVAQAVRRCLRRASDVAARISTGEGEHLVVLSHASDEQGVREFAERIATAVRDLGLHHPHSPSSRFVTVSTRVALADVGRQDREAGEFLEDVLRAE